MQIYPQGILILDANNLPLHKSSTQAPSYHHGHSKHSVDHDQDIVSPLLAIPSESLTHITAFLDPASIFALGKTNKTLHEHVNDDNTWHRAFSCQFLGEGGDIDHSDTPVSLRSALLRRTEDSWRKEFVLRCNLLRRWERSRNGTIAHAPHYSLVDCMHLLTERSHGPALLSASLKYGVVARSLPLTGKVLKGFLSAADGIGIGIGNPNAEFMPNASACAITSDGWNARVAWGFENGEIALASASRIMEAGRTVSKVTRCRVTEQHRSCVVSTVWDDPAFVTASVDGEVRVWDGKRARCVWVLKDQDNIIPDPCVCVVSNLSRGIVLATKRSGTTIVWTGISTAEILADRPSSFEAYVALPKLKIPLPDSSYYDGTKQQEQVKMFLDLNTPVDYLSFGILYAGDPHFYRVNADLSSGSYEYIMFANGSLGPLRVLYPFFKPAGERGEGEEGKTVIFAGDLVGRVSLYDWSAKEGDSDAVPSSRQIDAHSDIDGGVTALACTADVLAVGSMRGSTRIYDVLTLRLLREFPSPISRTSLRQGPEAGVTRARDANAVREIILERDMLIVAAGERVLAWKAGPVKPHTWKPSGKSTLAKGRNAKWHKRLEIAQDITESRQAAADSRAHVQQSYDRQRAQLETLDNLGLDEHEALEYVLMLSRDEEEARHRQGRDSHRAEQEEDGVFETDFDDIPSTAGDHLTPFPSPPSGPSRTLNPSPPHAHGSPMLSNVKVQVAPPLRPEPKEAGLGVRPLGIGVDALTQAAPPVLEDTEHFPVISASASSAGTGTSTSWPSPRMSPSASGSWSARLKVAPSASGTEPVSGSPPQPGGQTGGRSTSAVAAAAPSRLSVSGLSLLSESLQMHSPASEPGQDSDVSSIARAYTESSGNEELDADLRLAIELSLAEALSQQHI
ncbi:hypothetical protein M0805_005619 [Coniferiporia weirii]|nr:hypothetical protein M0805_005619 [Coniferiporia weirii]